MMAPSGSGDVPASDVDESSVWADLVPRLRLKAGEVHVWRASLARLGELPALWSTLTADERSRADRFGLPRDRARFVTARGLLRVILGWHLDRDPAVLRFRYGPQGKPALADGGELRFNVAHAGDLALYAFSLGCELGVDVERVRTDLPLAAMADVVLSPRDRIALAAAFPTRRPDAFFPRWVLKEAYVKAVGAGMSMALERISIDLGPDSWATVMVDGAPAETDRWRLRSLDLGAGHVAALAVEGSDWRLICRRWRDAVPAATLPPPLSASPRPSAA